MQYIISAIEKNAHMCPHVWASFYMYGHWFQCSSNKPALDKASTDTSSSYNFEVQQRTTCNRSQIMKQGMCRKRVAFGTESTSPENCNTSAKLQQELKLRNKWW